MAKIQKSFNKREKATLLNIALIQERFIQDFNVSHRELTHSKQESVLSCSHSYRLESYHKENMNLMREKTKKHIQEASKKADLVLLQELHTTQYFCQSEETKYFEFAQSFEDNVGFFSAVAKECRVVLVTSLFEQRAKGLYHNTAVVFEKDGSIAGKYRKMHIPDDPQFYEKFYFTPGDLGFKPIATSVGKLGVLICWDQWFPEAARIMALQGADMLIYPTAIGWFDGDSYEEQQRQLDAWQTIQRGHAIANGIPVASINRVGFELDTTLSQLPITQNQDTIQDSTKQSQRCSKIQTLQNEKSANQHGIRFFGNSFVCGAQGEILGQASCDREEILYVTLDLERTKAVRDIWPFFRDRRIESYGDILKLYGY